MDIKNTLKDIPLINKTLKPLGSFYRRYLVSDISFINKKFKLRTGRDLNLKNPHFFNDKLQWLKLNWENKEASICADKYLVRSFVSERIGDEYLSNLLAVYDSVEEIKIEELPNKFVLKGTHGSGFNIICSDKTKIDWTEKKQIMKKWLDTNYYWSSREPVYKNIRPRIIAEEFLDQIDSEELRDYRFFCFDGVPKFITVDFSITDKKKTRRNVYDLEWNLLDVEISYPRELSFELEMPKKLNEMIELSAKLAEGFPHARIDFYYINNRIIFGEITFFHQSGMARITPPEFEKTMGNWITLPK